MELSQVLQALRNADAAGDTEAARRLAQIASEMSQGAELPQETPKEGGVSGAFKRGVESTLSQLRTGIAGLTSPEAAAKAGLERGQEIGQKYEEGPSLDAFMKVYNEKGLGAAIAEFGGQIPKAIAEQLPNMGVMAAGARAGQLAGSPFGVPGRIVGGVTGAIAPSLLQQFGGNIERQASEGQPVESGKALAAAAPQAALDVAGSFIPLGGRLVSKITGIPLKALSSGTANVAKLAEEKMLASLAKGTAKGVLAEVPTEVAQQMLERAQAGLSLTDADALAEYGQTAYQVSLLGPLGAVGRFSEKAGARADIAKERDIASAEARKQALVDEENARIAEEARKQTPEYAQQVYDDYNALQNEVTQLKQSVKKPPKGATVEEKAAYRDVQRQIKEKEAQLQGMLPEYSRVKPGIVEQIKAQQEEAAKAEQDRLAQLELLAAQQQQEAQQQPYFQEPQATLPGMEAAPQGAAPQQEDLQAKFQDLTQRQFDVRRLLEDNQQQYSDAAGAADTARIQQLKKIRAGLVEEQNNIESGLQELANLGIRDYTADLAKARAELQKSQDKLKKMQGEAVDPDKVDKLADQIDAQKAKIAELEKRPELQQQEGQLGFNAVEMEPRVLPAGETKGQFAARVYEPGAVDVESQEQAYLQDVEAQRLADEAEGARAAKVAPEVMALRRIQERPAGAETSALPFPVKPEEAAPQQNQVLASMAQDLLQAPEATAFRAAREKLDTLVAERNFLIKNNRVGEAANLEGPIKAAQAELRDALKALRNAPFAEGMSNAELIRRVTETPEQVQGELRLTGEKEPFRLYANQQAPARATDRQSISERLASALMRDDLRPQTRALFERAEKVLPESDSTGMLSLLDTELRRIEQHGRPVPVAKKTIEGLPVSGTRVQKRVDVTPERGILRRPAPALANAAELESLVAQSERALSETDGSQMGLFAEEEKKLGAIKPDASAFQRFMRSPYVNKLRKALREGPSALQQAQELPAMQARIKQLQQQLEEARAINLEYSKAASILQHGRKIAKLGKDRADANAALVDLTMLRMPLAGRIDELVSLKNAYDRQIEEQGLNLDTKLAYLFEPLNTEYANVVNELTSLNKDLAELDANMQMLDAQLKVEKARADLARLNPKTTTKAQIAQMEEALRAEQTNAGMIEQAVAKMLQEDAEAEGKARRAQEAVDASNAEKLRNDQRKEEQKRLEAMYGSQVDGRVYEPQADARRAALEVLDSGTPKDVQKVIDGLGDKDPRAVIKSYRGQITKLERKMIADHKAAVESQSRDIAELQKAAERAEAAYKNTVSADARAKMFDQLQKADAAYRDAVEKLAAQPLSWKGKVGDEKRLQQLETLVTGLERSVESGKLAMPTEQAPRSAKKMLTETQKKVKAEETRKEEIANRTTGPAISVTETTKSEVEAARKAKKTVFTGKQSEVKGDTPGADTARQKSIERIKDKQAKGETLNAFEEHELKQSRKRNQETLELDAVPLSDKAVADLNKGDLVSALNDVAANSKTPLNQIVAKRLAGLLANTKVKIVSDLKSDSGQSIFGDATSDGSEIRLNKEIGLNEETLLHESVHAATTHILSRPESELTAEQLAAKRELEQLFEAAKNDDTITSSNAKSDIYEFASEALSNRLLQVQLYNKPWTLKNAWDSFKKFILDLLGVNYPKNMLETALAAVDTLMTAPVPMATPGTSLRHNRPKFTNPEFANALSMTDKLIAKDRGWYDTVKANSSGLAFETSLVDRFAGFERLAKHMEPLVGSQMMYYLRMYDQRMNFVAQAVEHGSLNLVTKKRADGREERIIEAGNNASIRGVVQTLREAKDIVGNGEAVNRLFTLYFSGIRAKNKGFSTLNFGNAITEADFRKALNEVESNEKLKDIFERARDEYNEYNRDMMRFVADTGAIPRDVANKLVAENDYIPWYRERNGVAELVIGSERPIKIGNIKQQPYLKELVGGDRPILDFMTSSVQNTNMLTDMALRNLAVRNAIFELVQIDGAKVTRRPTEGPDVVRFRVQPEDKNDSGERYAMIDTGKFGVPADLLVTGMEGIPTQLPMVVRALSFPARLLRKAVTASPLYAARQLFRDSLAAPLLTGADFAPVLGALKEIGSPAKAALERRGIVGGQIFTGTSEDLSRVLTRIAEGKPGWMNSLAKWESITMEADALTRRAQYNSYIAQGLSEMEATLLALESMNFNKRGASPSIHWANSLIPFFNAQIQGLNVLYKSMFGKMPFSEKLKIKEKLLTRGALMAATTLAYAASMQDDEAYKNATPEQKYGSWFIRVPGFDQPVRLPVPFEIGYIFKALPEAVYNTMVNEHGGEEAVKAFTQIIKSTIPGGSSYGIPQALRPAIEVGLNRSFYTGNDILTRQEQALLPEAQYRANTTELAKMAGKTLGVSPILMEELVRGYTSTTGLAILQALSFGVMPDSTPAQAAKRWSDMPVVGGAFQPNDAGGIINRTYERMDELAKVKNTVDSMIAKGQTADAMALIDKSGNDYMVSELAGDFRSNMNKLTQYQRAVEASSMSPQEKRKALDEVRQMKIQLAKLYGETVDKTTRQ